MKQLQFSAIFSLFFVVGNLSAASDSLYWYTYFADSVNSVVGFPKIAADAKGNLKIAYRRGHDVGFAEFDGKDFKLSLADTGSICCDAKLGLALDNDGNARIIREDDKYSKIYYLAQNGSKWTKTIVDSVGSDNLDYYQVGIAVDKKNISHLFYPKEKGSVTFLNYRTIDKDGKTSDPIIVCSTCGYNGKWANITTDSLDKPWISYFVNEKVELGLAHLDNGNFKYDLVDTGDKVWEIYSGYYSDLKADTAQNILVSYQNYSTKKIMLATGNSLSGWKLEPVDTIIQRSIFSSQSALTTDGKGNTFLAYSMIYKLGTPEYATESQLMYAEKKNGVWKKLLVDSGDVVGEYASIVLKPDGLPAIAYYDRTKHALKLAVASHTAPSDTNKNGIPDYQETAIRRNTAFSKNSDKKTGAENFDTLGRKLPNEGVEILKKFDFSKKASQKD